MARMRSPKLAAAHEKHALVMGPAQKMDTGPAVWMGLGKDGMGFKYVTIC